MGGKNQVNGDGGLRPGRGEPPEAPAYRVKRRSARPRLGRAIRVTALTGTSPGSEYFRSDRRATHVRPTLGKVSSHGSQAFLSSGASRDSSQETFLCPVLLCSRQPTRTLKLTARVPDTANGELLEPRRCNGLPLGSRVRSVRAKVPHARPACGAHRVRVQKTWARAPSEPAGRASRTRTALAAPQG